MNMQTSVHDTNNTKYVRAISCLEHLEFSVLLSVSYFFVETLIDPTQVHDSGQDDGSKGHYGFQEHCILILFSEWNLHDCFVHHVMHMHKSIIRLIVSIWTLKETWNIEVSVTCSMINCQQFS